MPGAALRLLLVWLVGVVFICGMSGRICWLGGRPGLPRGRRLALVVGFLFAALRMRAHDLLGFAWSPMDWLLSAESRTNGLITASVGSLAIYIQAVDGFHSLVTDGWGSCAVLGGALFALARWLRRVRGIELAGRAGDDE
ncbi:hypothetical protein [Streptomyces reniochalinae]